LLRSSTSLAAPCRIPDGGAHRSPIHGRVLRGGALDEAQAEIVFELEPAPSLRARGRNLVVTISGSLTERELIAVAESLRVVRR